MITETIEMTNRQGLHTRPTSLLCKIILQSNSNVTLSKGKEKANGKSVMEVLMLAVEFGDKVEVQISGSDEQMVWKQIKMLVDNHFHEKN